MNYWGSATITPTVPKQPEGETLTVTLNNIKVIVKGSELKLAGDALELKVHKIWYAV